MYTLSIRPRCRGGGPNQCITFEQSIKSWKLSTYDKSTSPQEESIVFGLDFYSPLNTVSISVEELAALFVGMEDAYELLCDTLYANADKDLADTPFGSLQVFMECIPRGLHEEPPTPTPTLLGWTLPGLPILYDQASKRTALFDGAHWCTVLHTMDTRCYVHAGTCFGWDVLYCNKETNASVTDPRLLAKMVKGLMENLTYISNDKRAYVKNVYGAF